MAIVRSFKGIHPPTELAQEIIAPPYDVLDEQEARAIVARIPKSFLHVTRSEVDLPEGSDSHSKEAYAKARENFDAYVAKSWMVQDESPCFYVYSQTWMGRTQHGLMAVCKTADYDANIIKKHELTRPDKEQDRVDHIEALDAQTGLVFLTYRDQYADVQGVMKEAKAIAPTWVATTDDGVTHTLRIVSDVSLVQRIEGAFAAVESLYIADGHHRSAAASRVAKARQESGDSGYFMAGIFPDSELKVLPYNRVVRDLHGYTVEDFLAQVAQKFDVHLSGVAEPSQRKEIGMYLQGNWYTLTAKAEIITEDVVASLDVSLLQDHVLHPLLGIENPRTDTRISFVGGIRGHKALSSAVDALGTGVAFCMYATGMDQLLDVADANRLMPPKSTWFEPKLRGGVLVHRI